MLRKFADFHQRGDRGIKPLIFSVVNLYFQSVFPQDDFPAKITYSLKGNLDTYKKYHPELSSQPTEHISRTCWPWGKISRKYTSVLPGAIFIASYQMITWYTHGTSQRKTTNCAISLVDNNVIPLLIGRLFWPPWTSAVSSGLWKLAVSVPRNGERPRTDYRAGRRPILWPKFVDAPVRVEAKLYEFIKHM